MLKTEFQLDHGRVKITHENGTIEYVTLERADEPIQEGTPINKVLFDKINMLGAHTEIQQYISQTTELNSSSDNWEEVQKGEEAVFELPEKRFLLLIIDFLSYQKTKNTSKSEAKTIYSPAVFILDTVEKKAYSLTTNTLLFEGEDFSDSPAGYKICREITDIGVGFALKNIENNTLKIQPFTYNNSSTSTTGHTIDYSILLEIHEFLSYKEE